MRNFILFLLAIIFSLSKSEAQIVSKDVCYCNLFLVKPKPYGLNDPEGSIHNNIKKKQYVLVGEREFDHQNKSGIDVVLDASFKGTVLMPRSMCNGTVRNISSDYVNNTVLCLQGPTIVDQDNFNNQIKTLKDELKAYIDRRHEEVKETLLANINQINKEAMNELLVQDTFLLKNGLAEVITEEPVNKKLVEALQHYKVSPDLLKNGIVAVIRDSTEVRDELIRTLRTYQIPADSINVEARQEQ